MDNNYAFIDGNNLYHGAMDQGIPLDYGKLRLYLRNAMGVKRAFLFIGYVPSNTSLYNKLQQAGFTLVFKPTVPYVEGDKRTIKMLNSYYMHRQLNIIIMTRPLSCQVMAILPALRVI